MSMVTRVVAVAVTVPVAASYALTVQGFTRACPWYEADRDQRRNWTICAYLNQPSGHPDKCK